MFWRILIFMALSSLAKAEAWQKHCSDHSEMGTPFQICVYAKGVSANQIKKDFTEAFFILRKIDAWMSDWKPKTELNEVNRRAGQSAFAVRDELFSVLDYALSVSRESEGAFDPTFNVFWGLYNFKKGRHRRPSQAEIDERLPLLNYKNVQVDKKKKTVFLKKKGMKLGLGGIGQGYGVDQMVRFLRRKYSAGFVDGSGDLYFWGKKPGGELWTTAIRDPRDHSKNIARIYGTDFAVTTAGDDEKFFFDKGERIHHIIDPKTGHPARRSRQVTVIAPTAMEADAWDTAGFVMGPGAKAKIEKLGMQAVFVTDENVVFTKGLKKKKTEWGEVFVLR